MSFTFSPEAPHYNGNSLSPASPKPIHIPEPQNIPVLQNQIDPVFNLVSTHMETSNIAEIPLSNAATTNGSASVLGALGEKPADPPDEDIPMGEFENTEQSNFQNSIMNQLQDDQIVTPTVATTDQPPETTGHPVSATTPAQSNVVSFAQNENQNKSDTASDFAHTAPEHPSNAADPTANTEGTTSHTQETPQPEVSVKSPNRDLSLETGNIQTLLDNLIASASSAAPAENDTTPAAPAPSSSNVPQVSSPGSAQTPISALPTPAGLPPRPPPQDGPAIHPNYAPGQSIRSYHHPPPPSTASNASAQPQSSYRPPQNYPPANAVAPNGMPPPPTATFQQPPPAHQPQVAHDQQHHDEFGRNVDRPDVLSKPEVIQVQNAPDKDRAWEDFLRDEAVYVAEGTWDRFPQGSRLFVGNLFTEKVSKRHIWDIFSKYGRLAQISMKNAYGFVQFIDPGCSTRAMQEEEGAELGGRKIHLEISKPQKNSRNAAATTTGDNMRAGHGRRSRSPDRGRSGANRQGSQRQGPNSFDRSGPHNHFDRRARDDYRPVSSPSPRAIRGFDSYAPRNGGTDRYYGGRRSRSRSSHGRNARYRSRSPRGRDPDDEAALPIPRRNPVQVPDVQIILVDESDRTFVGYIQQSFKDRGLRCEVIQLPRGVGLHALVKRQIIEGVQAVVKIHRRSQVSGKIPLQIFDRSGGMNNVRFDEYEELDAGVAADVVVRSKNPQPAAPPVPPQYPPNPGYGQPQSPYGHQAQHMSGQQIPPHSLPAQQPPLPDQNPHIANAISSLDGPTLQKLLGSLNSQPHNQHQHSPQQQPQSPALPPDLAALLSNVTRQTPQQQQSGYQQPPPILNPGYPYQSPVPQQQPPQSQAHYSQQQNAFAGNQALSQLLHRPQQSMSPPAPQQGYSGGPHHHQQQQQTASQQNVQDIMAQLAKYRG